MQSANREYSDVSKFTTWHNKVSVSSAMASEEPKNKKIVCAKFNKICFYT